MAISILPPQPLAKPPTPPLLPTPPPGPNVSPSRCCNRNRKRNCKRSHDHPEPMVVKPLAQKQKPRRAPVPPRSRKPQPNVEPIVVKPPAPNDLLAGKVRILKSSETAPKCFMKKKVGSEAVLESSDEEAKVEVLEKKKKVGDNGRNNNKEVELDYFAGFGFYTSPPPSSLPIPRFLAKKKNVL